MALLSISQAAREWKTSRSRLYALKADGKLSFSAFPDGRPALDTGELIRALGEPNGKPATPPQHTPGQPDQAGLAEQNRLLSVQLEVTERERDAALADKDRLMGILENQTRLLQGPETAQDRGKAGGYRMLAVLIVAVTLGAAAFLIITERSDLMTWSKSKETAQAGKGRRLTDAELGMPQGLTRKEKYEWLLEEKIKFLVGEVAEAKMARETIRKAYVSTGDEALLPRNKEAQNRYYDLLDELRDTREKLEASKAKTAQSGGNPGN